MATRSISRSCGVGVTLSVSALTVLCAVIAVLTFVLLWHTPLQGDDLAYAHRLAGDNPIFGGGLRDVPGIWRLHWHESNGRLANLLMIVLALAPHWVLCALIASLTMAMYRSAAALTGMNRGVTVYVLVAAMAFGLPWWDYMTLFDCQLNYICASGAVLWAAWLFAARPGLRGWGIVVACLWCAMAGAFHEGASAPLLGAAVLYWLVRRPALSRAQKYMLAAFALGTAEVTLSPGIIARAGQAAGQSASMTDMLLVTNPLTLLLWLLIGVLAIIPKTRPAVKRLFDSPLAILAVAAALSAALSVLSGIVGRSGWFAQLFAMITLAGWSGMYRRPSWRPVSAVLSLAVIAQLCGAIVWQKDLKRQFDDLDSQYSQSPDGVVFIDATPDNGLPWWLLNRLRGLPDADDRYLLYVYAIYYGTHGHIPVIVARTPDATHRFADTLPDGAIDLGIYNPYPGAMPDSQSSQLYVARIDGKDYIVQPVRGRYYLAPLAVDPGDDCPEPQH